MKDNRQGVLDILGGLPIAAFVIDKDHKILHWNRALESLTGLKAEVMIGTKQHWKAFYKSERPLLADLLVDGKVEEIQNHYTGKYAKSDLLDDAYEATDYFSDLGDKGKWLRFTAAVIRDSLGAIVAVIETLEDITKLKKSELELIESEIRFHAFMDNIPSFVYIKDKSLRHTYSNSAAAVVGKSLETYIGTRSSDILPPGIAQKIEDNDRRVISEGLTIQDEFTFVDPDGKTRNIQDIKFPIQMPDGSIYVGGLAFDITERKLTEQSLAKSEQKFKWLYINAPIAYHILSADGIITDVNQRWCEVLKYSKEEVIGKPIFNFILEEERRAAKKSFKHKKASQQDYVEGSKRNYRTKTGEVKTFKTYDFFVVDKDNKITSVQTTIEDITDREWSDEKLRESEERYSSVTEDTPGLICRFLPDGTTVFVNKEYSRFFGKTYEELIGSNIQLTILREDRKNVMSNIASLTEKSPIITFENKNIIDDKHFRWMRWTNRALFDNQGQIISIQSFGEDITRRKRAEQLLTTLNQAAVAMGTAMTHQDIFNTVVKELKQLDISCMLFPLDETQDKLYTKYLSYESVLLDTAEKLVGIKHEDFSFPIEAIGIFREVVREKKTLFTKNTDQIMWKLLPKLTKKISAQIIKLLRVPKNISAPLIVEDQVIGMFSIQSNTLTEGVEKQMTKLTR